MIVIANGQTNGRAAWLLCDQPRLMIGGHQVPPSLLLRADEVIQ